MGGSGGTSPLPWDKAKTEVIGEVLPIQTLTDFKQVLRVEVFDKSRTELVWDWVHKKDPKLSKPKFAHLDHGGTLRLAMLLLQAYRKELGIPSLEAIFFTLGKLFEAEEGVK